MAGGFLSPQFPLALATDAAVTQAGFRSMISFWMGGAGAETTPPAVADIPWSGFAANVGRMMTRRG